jgi:hypothetical protein
MAPQLLLFRLILTRIVPLAAGLFIPATAANAQVASYSTWQSHNPRVCLDAIYDRYYLAAITDAWIVRGDEQEGRRLLQEYADRLRCETDLGMVAATYTFVPSPEDEEWLTVASARPRPSRQEQQGVQQQQGRQQRPAQERLPLEITPATPADEFWDEWSDDSVIRDGGEVTRLPVGPRICLGGVMVWQDNAQWNTGEWNARHRGWCVGATTGQLVFDLKGDHIDDVDYSDIYQSLHTIIAPGGGAWDQTETFNRAPGGFAIRWSKESSYALEIPGEVTHGMQSLSLSKRPINVFGREYPKITVGARGEVPFPDAPPGFRGRRSRLAPTTWDGRCLAFYTANGWPYPVNLMPVSYQNHHVRPLRWNGRNDGSNCYRLQSDHHYFFTLWWQPGTNFRTPRAQ